MKETGRSSLHGTTARKHGTASAYKKGCRCRPCTDAGTAANKRWRTENRERHAAWRRKKRSLQPCSVCGRWLSTDKGIHKKCRPRPAPQPRPGPQHGTHSGYTGLKCREQCCRAAWNEYFRKWRKRDSPAARRYRAHIAKHKGTKRSLIYARDGGICYLCGIQTDPSSWHVEHKIPLSKGGTNAPTNLGVSCPPCNLTKRTRRFLGYVDARNEDGRIVRLPYLVA